MAATCLLSEEHFLCPVCLDLFVTPVTLQCGHSFCRKCISENWKINRRCQCPVCKKRFDPGHELHANIFISEMVAQFRQAVAAAEAGTSEVTRPGEVPCDACRTDGARVCPACHESDHGPHDVVPLREECEGRKGELGRMLQDRRLKVQELRRWARRSQEAADEEAAGGALAFSGLLRLVEAGLAEATAQIRERQRAAAAWAEGLLRELDAEISELERRSGEVEELSRADDLRLARAPPPPRGPPALRDWDGVGLRQPAFEGTVARAAARLRETLGGEVRKLLEAELRRARRHAVDVTLDPNTAHRKLVLSDDGKQVNHGDVEGDAPDVPERFSYCVIVLGRQSFSSGRFYYEVEVAGKTKWDLGVVSASASRKGQVTSCPATGYWTLQLRNGDEYVALADPDLVLPPRPRPRKVGVFVDYEEGVVSFYDAEAADMIYSFTGCSFSDRLHPLFSPCFNDGGDNSAPLRISVVPQTE